MKTGFEPHNFMMTDEEREALRKALMEVHDRIHGFYPRGAQAAEAVGRELRNQLLVVDLAIHLADEAIAALPTDKEKVVERTANLLYGVRLLAPESGLEKAAELLLQMVDRVDRKLTE